MELALALLKSPAGPFVLAWAIVLLVLSGMVRFRWSVLYAGLSVVGVFGAIYGVLAYYGGKQDDQGSDIIDGPEFFGLAFVFMGSVILASITLALGGIIAFARHSILKRRFQVEHF